MMLVMYTLQQQMLRELRRLCYHGGNAAGNQAMYGPARGRIAWHSTVQCILED
jgi:hypothetical protein